MITVTIGDQEPGKEYDMITIRVKEAVTFFNGRDAFTAKPGGPVEAPEWIRQTLIFGYLLAAGALEEIPAETAGEVKPEETPEGTPEEKTDEKPVKGRRKKDDAK